MITAEKRMLNVEKDTFEITKWEVPIFQSIYGPDINLLKSFYKTTSNKCIDEVEIRPLDLGSLLTMMMLRMQILHRCIDMIVHNILHIPQEETCNTSHCTEWSCNHEDSS